MGAAMSKRVLPRYPIYIPSKGRAAHGQTMTLLAHDGVPHFVVVEPQEVALYRRKFPAATVLELPFRDLGSVIPARNWIKAHATAAGYERHWQLDDNIGLFRRWWKGKRLPCRAGVALRIAEDFTDRFANIAVSGLNYTMFAHQEGKQPRDPFWLNCHVYSCCLILNTLPYGWRGRYNEDTDLCLRVIADGWCTVLMNAFMVDKIATMVLEGGNTTALYQGDGRLAMARSLERQWNGVVETKRRWKRPQHVVRASWRKFDTPLKLKAGVQVPQGVNEYGMVLRQVAPQVRSPRLRAMLAEAQRGKDGQTRPDADTDQGAGTAGLVARQDADGRTETGGGQAEDAGLAGTGGAGVLETLDEPAHEGGPDCHRG
jgi:hypothetical protein